MLEKGNQLPDISLLDQNGNTISLRDFIDKKPLVIYFYPKDNTRVCTAQACSFRDSYEDFKSLGAEVIGISHDSVESHLQVSDNRSLPFLLLSDPKREAMKAFGVPTRFFGLFTKRLTFVFNNKGIVIHTFHSALNAQKHVDESLAILRKES